MGRKWENSEGVYRYICVFDNMRAGEEYRQMSWWAKILNEKKERECQDKGRLGKEKRKMESTKAKRAEIKAKGTSASPIGTTLILRREGGWFSDQYSISTPGGNRYLMTGHLFSSNDVRQLG
jgi:hypothetical protein